MNTALRLVPQTPPAARCEPSAWDRLPQRKRAVAIDRKRLLDAVLEHIKPGVTLNGAIDFVLSHIEVGHAPSSILDVARRLARGDNAAPNRATLYRWANNFLADGMIGLAPGHKGRERAVHGWESRAIRLFQQPQQPDYATVAYWLREEGWADATEDRVRRYLKSLPETEGKQCPARMGRHYYKQNLGPYISRDESVLPVGFVYQGDGHNCDVYVAHPRTGKPWRPEFTPWFDVRSHYLVGWYLSDRESGLTTLFSLSHALVHHDHVPAMIHVDPGSGFKNRMMTGEVIGYLDRLSIDFMAALPGNAKGKGLVEGFFNIFEERLGKRFATYCGHDRSDDYLRHLSKKVERGIITLPTMDQYFAEIARYVDGYNLNKQDRLGCAPADLWQQLQRVQVVIGRDALIRPREQRTVRRWRVSLWNRTYQHSELAMHNGRDVLIDYDLHNDATVTIRDLDGRFICEAEHVDRKPWMPPSRIEQLEQKRLSGQRQRLQDKLDEVEARGKFAITHDQQMEKISALLEPAHPAPALEQAEGETLDLLSPLLRGRAKEKGDSPLRLSPLDIDGE
jgi:putative transposase